MFKPAKFYEKSGPGVYTVTSVVIKNNVLSQCLTVLVTQLLCYSVCNCVIPLLLMGHI